MAKLTPADPRRWLVRSARTGDVNNPDMVHVPLTKEMQQQLTPGQILQILKDGNERFLARSLAARDLEAEFAATKEGQCPHTIVLGCIDSRVPAEVVFDAAIGDIMADRVAGNILNDELMAGLEYATHHLGAKLVVVLGHTKCGAVSLATNTDEATAWGLHGQLGSLWRGIRPAVHCACTKYQCTKPDLNAVISENVRLTCEKAIADSEILRDLMAAGKLLIVGAVYDIETGKVAFDHFTSDQSLVGR